MSTRLVPMILGALLATACATPPPGVPGSEGYVDPGPPPGPLGPKYAGQVVFHTRPLALTSADDSSVVRRYTLGQPLFGRYWSSNSPANVGGPTCGRYRVHVDASVNGKHVLLGDSAFTDELSRKNVAASFTADAETPLTKPWSADDRLPAQRRFQNAVVPSLHEGTNRLEVRVYVDCEATSRDTTIARGALDIEVPPGALDNFLAAVPDPPPSPFREDEKVSAELLTALRSEWRDREILGARVVSAQWEPIRDEVTNRLVRRRVLVDVYSHLKTEPNPRLCEVTTLPVERDAAGGPLLVGFKENEEAYPCAKSAKARR